MTLKQYCRLMLDVLIVLVIILSLPIGSVFITYAWLKLPNWVCCLIGVSSSVFTIYPGIKYMERAAERLL